MAGGVSRQLRVSADSDEYIRAAQAQCPVKAGRVVVTDTYDIGDHIPGVKRVLHGAVFDYDTEGRPKRLPSAC